MFFYITHKSPIWKKLELSKRGFRVFIVGFICYIFLHALLFSKFAETKEKFKLYRYYMYYMFTMDLFIMGYIYKFNSNKLNSNKLNQNDDIEQKVLDSFPTFQEFLTLQNNDNPLDHSVNNDEKSITLPIYSKVNNDEKSIQFPIYNSTN